MERALARRHASIVTSSSIRWSFTGGLVGWIRNTSQPRMDSCVRRQGRQLRLMHREKGASRQAESRALCYMLADAAALLLLSVSCPYSSPGGAKHRVPWYKCLKGWMGETGEQAATRNGGYASTPFWRTGKHALGQTALRPWPPCQCGASAAGQPWACGRAELTSTGSVGGRGGAVRCGRAPGPGHRSRRPQTA